jgi:hypothetical protein
MRQKRNYQPPMNADRKQNRRAPPILFASLAPLRE